MIKKDRKNLRWGYSTGACAAAAAKAAWIRLTRGGAPQSIWVHFLDGRERELPLLQSGANHMAAIRKNGGDDPDCTHGATLYADIRGDLIFDGFEQQPGAPLLSSFCSALVPGP